MLEFVEASSGSDHHFLQAKILFFVRREDPKGEKKRKRHDSERDKI